MDKAALIKAITEYHPASRAGIARGWSYYVGGMSDTGDWKYPVLLDASEEDLQQCLEDLIKQHKHS